MIMYAAVDLAKGDAPLGGGRLELRRMVSLAARDLLRRLLSVSTGIPGEEWRFGKDALGKPIVLADGDHVAPEVSISHSRDWVAAAISTLGPVGIDVECRRQGRDICGIAEASFGEAERREVAVGGPDAFYRIWTLREAMAKADGSGLAVVVDRQDRVSGLSAVGAWTAAIDGRHWLLMHQRPDDGVHLSLAVASSVGRWPNGLPMFFQPS